VARVVFASGSSCRSLVETRPISLGGVGLGCGVGAGGAANAAHGVKASASSAPYAVRMDGIGDTILPLREVSVGNASGEIS
jgi:hypothetical protein